ncbi:MAG: hypothetical protein C3F13_13490 [Anaerolineales bacterium]|nr:hypothetical protein [Anaerolineae bacterium]PWB51450.1 MAG: hypothetical protein C3F13_13490 [Anaerolineales bacterium]
MSKPSRFPLWLIGGTLAWLLYAISLGALHLILLDQWGVPFTIKIYHLESAQPLTFLHALLIAMVFPGFFLLEAMSFLHMHFPWLDSAVYNWGRLTLLSSIPVFIIGALLLARDRRLKLAGAILGLLLLGGSLLFVLNGLLIQ